MEITACVYLGVLVGNWNYDLLQKHYKNEKQRVEMQQ
jgi:hypothetical protein